MWERKKRDQLIPSKEQTSLMATTKKPAHKFSSKEITVQRSVRVLLLDSQNVFAF